MDLRRPWFESISHKNTKVQFYTTHGLTDLTGSNHTYQNFASWRDKKSILGMKSNYDVIRWWHHHVATFYLGGNHDPMYLPCLVWVWRQLGQKHGHSIFTKIKTMTLLRHDVIASRRFFIGWKVCPCLPSMFSVNLEAIGPLTREHKSKII